MHLSPALAGEARPGEATTLVETVTVTATRLSDRDESPREVPASTTVITRAEIRSSGARTLQELLARIAGAVAYDQTGNAIQTTVDLRGFTGGGITVLLDGARVNDPRNNSVLLETIALEGIERIEITRGPAAATVGGGSAGGVVNIVTREGGGSGIPALTCAAGTYDARRIALEISGRYAPGGDPQRSGSGGSGLRGASHFIQEESPPPGGSSDRLAEERPQTAWPPKSAPGFDWLLTAARERTDGVRENADASLRRYTAGLGWTFSNGSRLAFTAHRADDEIGSPGALTLDEWKVDPDRSPFNQLDNSEVAYRQGTVNWKGPLAGAFSMAANLSYFSRDSQSLTTGRSAAVFGGFLLDARVRTLSGALQSTAVVQIGRIEHSFTFGGESSGGTSDADACGTKTASLAHCDPSSFFNSANRTRRQDAAFFIQDSVRLPGHLTLLAGGRWDRSRLDYRESAPDPSNDRNKTFSEPSLKAGVTWNPSTPIGLYAGYGESFQPPTVEDLFAFPTFGSNPHLDPTASKNYEVGLRGAIGASGRGPGTLERSLEYSVALFRANLTNEIVFDPNSPLGPFGANVNAGKSRRQGIEVTAGGRAFAWLSGSLAYSRTDATFLKGANEGNTVPLVPRDRISGSLDLVLPRGVEGRLDLLDVGEQVLVNDEANGQQRLDGYTVLNARAAWRPGEARRRAVHPPARPGFVDGLELFIEAHNFLDERYATSGISVGPASGLFVTPAPGRTLLGGVTLAF